MEKIVNKIIDLYRSVDGGAGGYGHIVFDDNNIETANIEWCIKEAERGEYELSEETRLKSIIALKSILPLSEEDRQKAIDLALKRVYSR